MATIPFIAPLEHREGELHIRAFRPWDGATLQRVETASLDHLRPWMPWARVEKSIEEAEVFCRQAAGRYLLGEDFLLSFWIADELVGGSGFHLRHGPLETGNAEIGMWISAAFAGQGLGARALAAVIRWGFTAWPWERLIWQCDTRNVASARVAEKNGLQREGVLRSNMLDGQGNRCDTLLYAILRTEWLQQQRQRQ